MRQILPTIHKVRTQTRLQYEGKFQIMQILKSLILVQRLLQLPYGQS